MTLWVFGDSFAKEFPGETRSYFHILAERLGTDLINKGLGATGLDYTYDQFNQHRNDIKDGDHVIVTLTDLDRVWFFKDRPRITNYWGFKYLQDAKVTRAERNAHEQWLCYLNNPVPRQTGLINFLYNLDLLARQKKTNIVALFCFQPTIDFFNESGIDLPNLIIGNRVSLHSISNQEYDPLFLSSIRDTASDGRPNHLLRSNHPILAEKLYEVITDRSLNIDDLLSEGFRQGVCTKESLEDPEFIKRELCFPSSFIYR